MAENDKWVMTVLFIGVIATFLVWFFDLNPQELGGWILGRLRG